MEVDELVAAAKEEPDLVIAECGARLAAAITPHEQAVCLRARSVAERSLGDLAASIQTAQQAIDVATDALFDEQAGLAWGTLGASLLYAGEIDRAREALRTGRSQVSGRAGLQLDMHMAGLHARTGEVDKADQLLGEVAAAAQRDGALELAGDALANRGTLAGYTGRLDQAETDLKRAGELFASIDHTTAAAQMSHNLGWVAALRGNYQQALDLYRVAADALTGFDFWEDAVHLLDRAEAKLNAGLYSEAATDATTAAASFAKHGSHTDEAEARLVAAHGFLASGNTASAATQAQAAAELFRDQERPGWHAESRLVLARCCAAVDLPALQRVADDLEAAGQHRAALTARLLRARHGDTATLDMIEPQHLSLVHVALYENVVAGRLAASGDASAALNLIRSRFVSTAEIRATIGSADVRGGLTAVWGELNEHAKSLSRTEGDDASLFEFAEWGSLVLVEPPPVAAPDDIELAGALEELRSMHAALRGAERDFDDIGDLPAQIADAENRVANLARRKRRSEPSHIVRPISIETVRAALPTTRLCRFVTSEGRLIRIDIDEFGVGSIDLASVADVNALSTELQLSLERLIAGSRSDRMQQAATQNVERIVDQLDTLLFDRAASTKAIVVVPPAELGLIPWLLLPSRRGVSTTVLPAASMLAATASGDSGRGPSVGRAVAIAGPGLAHAADEVAAVAAVYEGRVEIVLADDASVADACAALEGADIAHLAAHGQLRHDQPMLSSIELADGPLTIFDLHRLAPPPRVVVLANCFSARGVATDGGELIGAAAVLLGAGASWVIGCPVALPDDDATRAAMVALHTQLAADMEVPEAVTTAIESLDGRAKRIAQSLVVFGAVSV